MDYHFAFENHMCSVPFKYRFGKVILRVTDATIEVLLGNKRIACHCRSYKQGSFTTLPEHQPREHRDYGNWSPEIIVAKGREVGPGTSAFFKAIMASRPVAEQGFRSCHGILQLRKLFDDERLDAACTKALGIRALSLKAVKSLFEEQSRSSSSSRKTTTTNVCPLKSARSQLFQHTRFIGDT